MGLVRERDVVRIFAPLKGGRNLGFDMYEESGKGSKAYYPPHAFLGVREEHIFGFSMYVCRYNTWIFVDAKKGVWECPHFGGSALRCISYR